MAVNSEFYKRCEQLFSKKLDYGRRWKSSAAQALGIGRATLYRYFDNDTAVPEYVHLRLDELSGGVGLVPNDEQIVKFIARGLVDLQEEIDTHGWIKNGYPPVLQRAFDLASARSALYDDQQWPSDLAALTSKAQQPLYSWGIDLSWDPEGDFTTSSLVADGEITQECIDLAAPGRDPETELVENTGYRLLMDVCCNREDGQNIYTAFRRCVVTQPVLSNWTATLTRVSILNSVEGMHEIFAAFYQRVPEAIAIGKSLPICKVSRTILRKQRQGFHTECRDPEAIYLASIGDHDDLHWRPTAIQLRRAFRLYWCLPGLTEIALADQLVAAGWNCELWPDFDMVDLVATSPNGDHRIAVDVKDYLSSTSLAARFTGFKSYSKSHDCYLVVPDYLPNVNSDYQRRFHAVRQARGGIPVSLYTLSALLSKLGVE